MPLIEFNNLNKNAFISFLQSFNNSTELEFRFGNFVYDKTGNLKIKLKIPIILRQLILKFVILLGLRIYQIIKLFKALLKFVYLIIMLRKQQQQSFR